MSASIREGGCHCGQVRYAVETDLAQVIACNCSICTKHGLILTFVPEQRFRLLAGADSLATYRFNKHVIAHQHCTNCGVEPFARGRMPDGTAMVAVNLRCLDDIDLSSLNPTPFDGRSL